MRCNGFPFYQMHFGAIRGSKKKRTKQTSLLSGLFGKKKKQEEEDLKADGTYALVTNSLGKEGSRLCWGKVIEFDPPKKLVHTFTHEGLEGVETTCQWTLIAADGGTVLRLKHSGFELAKDGFKGDADHDAGWDEHFTRFRRVTN